MWARALAHGLPFGAHWYWAWTGPLEGESRCAGSAHHQMPIFGFSIPFWNLIRSSELFFFDHSAFDWHFDSSVYTRGTSVQGSNSKISKSTFAFLRCAFDILTLISYRHISFLFSFLFFYDNLFHLFHFLFFSFESPFSYIPNSNFSYRIHPFPCWK